MSYPHTSSPSASDAASARTDGVGAAQDHPLDVIEHLGGSLVQHGRLNNRIYLMKAAEDDMPGLPSDLLSLAREREYTKVTAKVPAHLAQPFLDAGFRHEAYLPGFYGDGVAAYYMGCFLDPCRANTREPHIVVDVINTALRKPCVVAPQNGLDAGGGLVLRELGPEDTQDMAELYAKVFRSYPFPILDPDYIAETIASHIFYYGLARLGATDTPGGLIALASMETEPHSGTVEMSDFATLPEARGAGAAGRLLNHMEQAAQTKGFRYAFSIARSLSYGMNIAFARAGYAYSGTMVNNTHIAGRIESMNVWHKPLGG